MAHGNTGAATAAPDQSIRPLEQTGEMSSGTETRENHWYGKFFGIGVDHFSRARVLMENEIDMDSRSYWKAVAAVWQDSERQPLTRDQWAKLWLSDRPDRGEVMTEAEREELAGLPERVAVYRGINVHNHVRGLSWTLDRDVAHWFALRFDSEQPVTRVVRRGTVLRHRIIALLQERSESEIIVQPRHVYAGSFEPPDPEAAMRQREACRQHMEEW